MTTDPFAGTTAEERLAGAALLVGEQVGRYPPPTEAPEIICERVDRRFQAHQGMIRRMERSMAKWRMETYKPLVKEAVDPENIHTSNLDAVLARKVVYSIAAGRDQVRIENDAAWDDRKEKNENAERFAIGCINIGNDLMRDRAQPTIQRQLAFFAPVRGGFVVCRGLLNKRPDMSTYPDWFPMDPRNLVFSRRADGIDWAAYRYERSRAEVRRLWPGFSFSVGGNDAYVAEDENAMEVVYDYYQTVDVPEVDMAAGGIRMAKRFFNCVLIDRRFAKPWEDTNSVHFPISIVPVGYMPELGTQYPSVDKDTSTDFGEDVFKLTEGVTDTINLVMSYAKQAIHAQIQRAVKRKGSGGGPEIEGYPLAPGADVNLDTDAQQDVEPIEGADIGQAPIHAIQVAQAEWYAGGLTAHALGQMPPGGLSGAALRLVGSNIGERSHPYLRSVELCVEGCLRNMLAQFETGGYDPIQVWGKSLSGARFDRTVSPEDVISHGRLEYHMLQVLPEDQHDKWAIAQMATTPDGTGKRLVDFAWARENLLGIQDPSLMDMQQDVERVKEAVPLVTLLDWRESAQKSGSVAVAQYLDRKIEEMLGEEYIRQLVLKMRLIQIGGAGSLEELMMLMAGMGGTGVPTTKVGGNGQQARRGVSARISSVENARPGTIGREPSPEAGRNSSMPRPGGRYEDIGLVTASRFGPVEG